SDWLADNKQTAIDFCTTILLANRTLSSDYDEFKRAIDTYLEEPPPEEDLEIIFDAISRSNIWPVDGLTESAVNYTLGLAERSGVLSGNVTAGELVDFEIMEAAASQADELG